MLIYLRFERELYMEHLDSVNDKESLEGLISRVKIAQEKLAEYSQEQIDKIFRAVALSASESRILLAERATEETGMGILEDKVIKNHVASEFVYNKYKNEKTCGVIEIDNTLGIEKIASPIGVIGAIIPTTNPTSTVIFKILIAIKTRNAIIISPHPRAKHSTILTAKILLESAVKAGAPKDIIAWIDEPSLELTKALMSQVDLILATGGAGLVKSAYSSGKPAIGVGAGNTPVIIDESADIPVAVSSIIHSKIFDNGMICASEQAIIAVSQAYEQAKAELIKRGCYFLIPEEIERLRELLFPNGEVNSNVVGKDAQYIAKLIGADVDENVKLLIAEIDAPSHEELLSHEKLCPVLAICKASTFEKALDMASLMLEIGGMGHTASIYIDEINQPQKLSLFKDKMKACRILVNTPSSQGGVGDVYNFGLAPSLTLGCGSWGGNSVCENIGVKQLLNIKTLALRRENMLWLKAPKIYMKRGCFSGALDEIKENINGKKVFVVTDKFLFNNGFLSPLFKKLSQMDAQYDTFYDVDPDPTLLSAKNGALRMSAFKPDTIIAFGGGSAMDVAKIMWLLYEHPEANFKGISKRFGDIKKRIYPFPKMSKTFFIAIPTTSGTGSEVTPFSVITDENSGIKYPIADYELLPHVAIIDVDFHISAPKGLTCASGIDALTHAIEAYTSIMATDFTDALALGAIKLAFEALERAYNNGEGDIEAREKMANCATMAGIAFANAFLGICHSMAHKLGSFHHLPHGIANALLIEHVIRFNSTDAPTRMGTFSQYKYPIAKEKYAQIARHLGFDVKTDDDGVEKLIQAIKELKSRLDIKESIKDYGIDEESFLSTLDEMSRHAFDDQCTLTSPRYPLVKEIREIYLRAYYGK